MEAIARALPGLQALRRRMELFDVAGRRVLDDTAGHPESLSAAFEVAALLPHARLHVGYVLRGSRGPLVNAQNATALADLALLHDAASIAVSAAAASHPGDLVLLLGAQGMDDGAGLLRAALGA
jgi:UDP-N-acetylmuramoyl-L-alanyl-D-glutamate--2,6-diaminopimelate ligase